MACTRRDIGDAVRSLLACGDNARLAPSCERSEAWTKVLISNGSDPSAMLDERRSRCVREGFDTFLCGLPPASGSEAPPRPPDWAFSDDPPSVGKFIARWAMH
eukprot:3073854-Prymnesium_polylepis.1